LLDLISSIEDTRPAGADVAVCVLDVGLRPEQRERLGSRVDRVVEPGWDLDFPSCADTPAWYRAMTARPFLPKHFPDVQTFVWLDSDTWLQDWRVVELLVRASRSAGGKALGIVPEIHRSFTHLFAPNPNVQGILTASYAASFGQTVGRQLGARPVFNSGAFGLGRESPVWANWAEKLREGLQAHADKWTEQNALNLVIYSGGASVEMLPAWCNWPCHLRPPMLDRAGRKLTEPSMPYEALSLVHLISQRGQTVALSPTDGTAAVPLVLDYARWKTWCATQPGG
jgi:hypothetical protein